MNNCFSLRPSPSFNLKKTSHDTSPEGHAQQRIPNTEETQWQNRRRSRTQQEDPMPKYQEHIAGNQRTRITPGTEFIQDESEQWNEETGEDVRDTKRQANKSEMMSLGFFQWKYHLRVRWFRATKNVPHRRPRSPLIARIKPTGYKPLRGIRERVDTPVAQDAH